MTVERSPITVGALVRMLGSSLATGDTATALRVLSHSTAGTRVHFGAQTRDALAVIMRRRLATVPESVSGLSELVGALEGYSGKNVLIGVGPKSPARDRDVALYLAEDRSFICAISAPYWEAPGNLLSPGREAAT